MAPPQHPPTVSVLIPTYNYARYLPEAIDSILNQSFTDFELIISDDDSNDGSAEIIEQYAVRDPRIRFKVQSPNLGMVRNWNWCLEQARGRYIKYVFGDDFLVSRDAIGRFVEMMESAPDIRLAASARIVVDEHSRPIEVWDHVRHAGILDGGQIITQSLLQSCNVIGEPSVVMFRKEDASRGFDPAFSQVVDWEFWIHLLGTGRFAYVDVPLCAFRRHFAQQTEVNRRALGAASEHPRLRRRYSYHFVRNAQLRRDSFERLYNLIRKGGLDANDGEILGMLRSALGSTYYGHLLHYKATRPYFTLRRFWRKHILHNLPQRQMWQPPAPVGPASVAPPSYISAAPQIYIGGGLHDEPPIMLDDLQRTGHDDIQPVSELFPAFTYERSLPEHIFADEESRTALLNSYRNINLRYTSGAASWMIELPQTTLAQNVLYLDRGQCRSVIYETHRPPDRADSPILAEQATAASYRVERDALCLLIGSVGSHTYGHWLVDDFTRLPAFDALRKMFPRRTIEILLPTWHPADRLWPTRWDELRTAAIRQYLRRARNYRIAFVNVTRAYHFEKLYYATPTTYHPVLKSPQSLELLNTRFRSPRRRRSPRRIFVTRQQARGRILQNSTEIGLLLQQRGFTIVDTETMSIAAQASMFANAGIVVGIMGGAMANTLFCKPGTRLIYLAPDGWMEPFYWDLAAACGHIYVACYGPVSATFGPAHMTSFTIPQSTVMQALREIEC